MTHDDDTPTLDELWTVLEDASILLDGAIDCLAELRHGRPDLVSDELRAVSDRLAEAWATTVVALTTINRLSSTGTL